MWEKLCTVPPPHGLLNGQNAARKNSTPENSWLCSTPSAARSLAPIWLVAVSAISRPTASVCAIRSFTPKACARPPALSRPDARWPSARASNVPGCTGPFAVPTPSLLSAAQDSVVVFKTSGSADQNAGPHDPSLSWGAPSLHATESCYQKMGRPPLILRRWEPRYGQRRGKYSYDRIHASGWPETHDGGSAGPEWQDECSRRQAIGRDWDGSIRGHWQADRSPRGRNAASTGTGSGRAW